MPVIVGLARGGATVLDGAHAQGVLRLLQDASAAPEGGEAFDISQPAAGGDDAPRARDPRTVSAIELMTGRPVQTPATEAAEDDTNAEPGFVGKGKRVRCALAGPDGAPLKKLKADGTKEESTDSENEARRSNAGGEMTITYRAASPDPTPHSFHVPAAPMAPLASYRSLISRFLPPPSEGRRMLVVDDSHTVRCFLQRTFETKGFQVDVATNGWQALTQMQSHMYDIVFLDLEMPVMNGYRCAQAIRQWERNVNRPRAQYICALTSHHHDHEQQLCRKVGMDQFESKPAKVQRLLDIVAGPRPEQDEFLAEEESASPPGPDSA